MSLAVKIRGAKYSQKAVVLLYQESRYMHISWDET